MIPPSFSRQCLRWALAMLLGAGLLGCGRGSLPPQASPDVARDALRTALEAWQNGEPTEDLAKGSPAIYFNDDKARGDSRRQLFSYELEDGHDFFGQSVRIRVNAVIELKNGEAGERRLTYLIDTSPVVVIAPD